MREVWQRQIRWARLRRACFPLFFVPEILGGAAFPLLAAGYAAEAAALPVPIVIGALAAVWYGAEMLLARVSGWHLSPLYPVHAALRDLLLPALWVDAWIGTDFVWRGHAMSVAADAPTA
jgi:ceramide glucosyltransferase